MTSFKQYLAESSTASTSFTGWNMSTLLDAHVNSGYDLSAEERKTFKQMKFDQKSGKKPSFFVLCHDDNEGGDKFYITKLHLEFTSDGKIGAEPSGSPTAEGTLAEMKKKFESL